MGTLDDATRTAFYKSHRDRSATELKNKHIAQYDHEFETLTASDAAMSVLEIGCGSGNFLRYLRHKNYKSFVGVDMDDQLADALSDLSDAEIYLDDVSETLETHLSGRTFDRIVLFDVLEHIDLPMLRELMKTLHSHIAPGGKVLIRVPNVESPWGLKMQFGTFDHVTPLGPGRLAELAIMTDWHCERCFPQPPMNPIRRTKEALANGILSFLLSYKPDIWTANVLAVFSKPNN